MADGSTQFIDGSFGPQARLATAVTAWLILAGVCWSVLFRHRLRMLPLNGSSISISFVMCRGGAREMADGVSSRMAKAP